MKPYYPHPIYINLTHTPVGDVERYIVCAANRRKSDGLVICGARHLDNIMRNVADRIGDTKGHEWDQGFIDQFGHYVTREDAAIIVKMNNQPLRERVRGGMLFSENLY